jgi:hypothetical protein
MILHIAAVTLLTKATPGIQTLSKIEWFATNAVGLHLLMSPGDDFEQRIVKSGRGSYILYGIS